MAINVNQFIKKFPNVDSNQIKEWVVDASVQGMNQDEIEEYIEEKLIEKETDDIEVNDEEDFEEDANAEEYVEEQQETLKNQIENTKEKLRHESEPFVPFENPNLSELQIPEEDEGDFEEEYKIPKLLPQRIKTPLERDEMVTKIIYPKEYEEVLKPFKPFFDSMSEDPSIINKLAAQIDGRYLPPYMQLKNIIINNPIKDPNNTKVLLDMVSEMNIKQLQRRFVPITQAMDIIRALSEASHHQASYDNYDTLFEKMFEDRRTLVSLIFILENYAENKQVSPFEFNIPKKILVQSIEDSFKNIKTLITENVVKEISNLKENLQGEMIDVGTIVEKNMTKFDSQIQEAVTKVLWKVKTDVESTNLEDIKKSILFLLNKRSATYNLGGIATAIMGIMLDDLERRLLENGFKLDLIKEQRKYTIADITKKLCYKRETIVSKAIPQLLARNLIKLYQNKTFSI